jgi:hypothetical protein
MKNERSGAIGIFHSPYEELNEFVQDVLCGHYDDAIGNFSNQRVRVKQIELNEEDENKGVRESVKLVQTEIGSGRQKIWRIDYFGKYSFEIKLLKHPSLPRNH